MTTTPESPAIPIVGIAGYARAGKDTAARALVDYGFTQRAFKSAITAFCHEMNPLLPDGRRWAHVHDDVGYEVAKDTVPGFVEALQDAGLAARRAIGTDVWVDAALRGADGLQVVLADTRFPNEAQAIVDRGGVVVRITRPGVGPLRRADGTVSATETSLDEWTFDLRISNDGSEVQLQLALMLGLQQIADARRGETSTLARVAAG